MKVYITKEGDQWDLIAKKIYGSEKYLNYLMKNNPKYLNVFQFDQGVELNVPDLLEEEESSDLPLWQRI